MAHGEDRFWDDERLKILRERWHDGWSASKIGHVLKASRSAVCGKLARLGLKRVEPQRGTIFSSKVSGKAARRRMQTANNSEPNGQNGRGPGRQPEPRGRAARALLQAGVVDGLSVEPINTSVISDFDGNIPIGQRKQLFDLERQDCRWPCGDPSTPDFYFCGGAAVAGIPYCEHHARVAFQPVMPKRRKPLFGVDNHDGDAASRVRSIAAPEIRANEVVE